MIESKVRDDEWQSGYDGRNLTTHSTGARVSNPFIVKLCIPALCARPVNSGVRPLSVVSRKEVRVQQMI